MASKLVGAPLGMLAPGDLAAHVAPMANQQDEAGQTNRNDGCGELVELPFLMSRHEIDQSVEYVVIDENGRQEQKRSRRSRPLHRAG